MKKNLVLILLLAVTNFIWSQKKAFTVEQLWQLNRLSGTSVSPNEQWAFYQTTSYDLASNKGTTTGFLMDLKTGISKEIFAAGSSFSNISWTKSNELTWLRTTGDKTELVVKNIATQTDKVLFTSNQEIEGLLLSDDQTQVICLQPVKVRNTVKDIYPDLDKTNGRVEDNLMYRHWNAWQGPTALHLFLYTKKGADFDGGIDILKGEQFAAVTPPFGGIDDVTITADGKTIYYSTKKKSGKDFALSTNSHVYAYDIATGATSIVSEAHKGYDVSPRLSPDSKFLTCLSMDRDGFEADKNNLILVDRVTKKETNLTAGLDLSLESYQWHSSGKSIFFTAATKGTKQIFEVIVATGKIRQVTNERCDIVGIQVMKDKILVERQSMLAPTDLWEVTSATGKQKQLTQINKELMDQIAMPTVEEKWITTTDGKKMLVWMILPPNMDKTKQYPSLLYCQGGPQSALSQYFSYRWNFLLMASEGYVVMAPNRRGLPGFGQEWNDAISKDWGGQAMRDYLVAVDSVSTLPYIDKSKIGAVGASYGGYSVYYLAGIHNNRFKTFVSHCGLFNLESWYGMTEELFFADFDIGGPYWLPENKELYRKNSPHLNVDKWNTPMLVIHGGKDFRVPESEGMQAFQVLQLKGIPSKFLYFPDEGHWITKPQNGVLWYRTYFDWLGTYLK